MFDPIEKKSYSSSNIKKHTWESPEANFVILKVYDILGKEVITLVNEYKEAGVHKIEFNGSNLPSGIYFYRIQNGSFSETQKFVLQK